MLCAIGSIAHSGEVERNPMKYVMIVVSAIHVALYRLSGGRLGGGMAGTKVLLLTTRGRKSGRVRTKPLGYFDQQGGYLIVASSGGGPHHPGWYHNLRSDPSVTVQLQEKVVPATAKVLQGEARAQAWQQVITTAPVYAGYEKRTSREIPLVLLQPGQ
jgi:deazaflavin-dependent oxidoreductase (nitroreductase family)